MKFSIGDRVEITGWPELVPGRVKALAPDNHLVVEIDQNPGGGLTCHPSRVRRCVEMPATIAELEALLNSEDDRTITINPDGSISAMPAKVAE